MIDLTPTPVPRRRKSNQEYAAARREKLIALLCANAYEAHVGEKLAAGEEPDPMPGPGYGICAKCRCYQSLDRLEVDHIDGRDWNLRSVNAWRRVARYWREFLSGIRLRVLCRSCNADGSRFRRER
jgi:hypothetical protein